jgi:Molybdopterin-guanine dinucleotide biosynthesis protein A
MVGVVLCGGASARMGTDKGLLTKDGKTWAQLAYERLKTVLPDVVISINERQRTVYGVSFTDADFVVDEDRLSIGGPLRGLLSVHRRFPGTDLMVLACDMIQMREEPLRELLDYFRHYGGQALVFEQGGYAQPLCGIYTSSALAEVADLAVSARLSRHSMMHALDVMGAVKLPCPVEYEDCFRNYNEP